MHVIILKEVLGEGHKVLFFVWSPLNQLLGKRRHIILMFIKLNYIFFLHFKLNVCRNQIYIHFHFDHYRKNGMHGVIHQCPLQGPTSCVWPNPSQNNGRIVINGGASWNYVVRVKNLHSQEAVISNVFFIQCLNAIGKNSIL